MDRLLIVSPNWLGDAVMALPAVADVRRAYPGATITVAARAPVAPLFGMVPGVDRVVRLASSGGLAGITLWRRDAREIGKGDYQAAILLPNAFASAWTIRAAGVPERWGLATDLRSGLLTRAVPRPAGAMHQADYYQALVRGLDIETGASFADVEVPVEARERAAKVLAEHGLPGGAPFVVMAPGAAYGRAKQWLPERFAELAALLWRDRQIYTVLVGSRGDTAACAAIAVDGAQRAGAPHNAPVDLSGRTDLPALAAVLIRAEAVVSNDSGAMHLAGAVGARVVAVFGATNERRTAPLRQGPHAASPAVITGQAWCRPCMLRECPIDHRCMRSVTVDMVAAAISSTW